MEEALASSDLGQGGCLCTKAGEVSASRARNVDSVLSKTHLFLGSCWKSCSRPPHAGAGSGGRSFAITRRVSANQHHGDLDHLESNVAAAVTDDLRADLDQLILLAVSDPYLIGSGVASVRRRLPKL
jgi:hypothetical protein